MPSRAPSIVDRSTASADEKIATEIAIAYNVVQIQKRNVLKSRKGINRMTELKDGKRPLTGRFTGSASELLEAINVSIGFDKRLWRQDIEGSLAHCEMLKQEGIISENDADAITAGLATIQSDIEAGNFQFKTSLEDIHMNVEGRLRELIGDAAGRLHTARSRNDQVATDFRLWTREQCGETISALHRLIEALLAQAQSGLCSVMPGFTHLQTAQPITWAHHMMAYVEMFGRDVGRFKDAKHRMNESPLGAAALAGTSFPVNRETVSRALRFDRPMANSIDAVSDRDFALEYLAAAAITAAHLSRLADEIVLWCSDCFGFASLGDSFTTGSSIMPQKRNPDAAELVRAKTGRINGSLLALLTVLKGLPLAYSKDLQEDKEQVFDAADSLQLSLAAMTGMLLELQHNAPQLKVAAGAGYSTATDLADWLVREAGLPFRNAHKNVSQLVLTAAERGCTLAEIPLNDMQDVCPEISEDARNVLNPESSVMSRTSFGGTAPVRVQEQIDKWKEKLKCSES